MALKRCDFERIKRVTIEGKEHFTIPGICYGTPLRIEVESDTAILAYEKGHKGWCGIGEQKYYPAKFLIFEETDDGRVIWPELFEIVYVRGERKEAFAKAMEEYWLMEKSRRKGGERK